MDCGLGFYYDSNVQQCQTCSDLCSHQSLEVDCVTLCPGSVRFKAVDASQESHTASEPHVSVHGWLVAIFILLVCLIVAVMILLLALCRWKVWHCIRADVDADVARRRRRRVEEDCPEDGSRDCSQQTASRLLCETVADGNAESNVVISSVRQVETAAVYAVDDCNSNNSSRTRSPKVAAASAAAAAASDSAICSAALSQSNGGVTVCHYDEHPLGRVDAAAAAYSVQCSEQTAGCDSSSTDLKSNSPDRPCGGLSKASNQLLVRPNTANQALIGTQLSGDTKVSRPNEAERIKVALQKLSYVTRFWSDAVNDKWFVEVCEELSPSSCQREIMEAIRLQGLELDSGKLLIVSDNSTN